MKRFFGAWAVADEAWPEVEMFLTMCADPEVDLGSVGAFVNQRPEAHVDDDGVGHVYAQGPLLHRTTEVERVLGATDYDLLAAELRGMASMAPNGVILHADSPGGMVQGVEKAAQAMADATLNNTVVVHTDGMCCSGMYWIAAAADGIVATETAMAGSIGAKLSWLNAAGAREAMGLKLEEMTSEGATLKGGLDDPNEEQRAHMQEGLDFIGERFQGFVSEHRAVDPEVYAAGSYMGAMALELGLVDEVGTAEEVRAELIGG